MPLPDVQSLHTPSTLLPASPADCHAPYMGAARGCSWIPAPLLSGALCVVCSYALGDLLEMAGYGLTQRAASSVRISGLCSDPYKVCCGPQKLPSHRPRAGIPCGYGLQRPLYFPPVQMSSRLQTS